MRMKLVKTVALATCLTMTVPVVAPSVGIETVEAAEDDWLFDEDEYDYLDDDDEDYSYNNTKDYSYDNVKKTFKLVEISESKGYKYSGIFELPEGKTNVHPINVKNSAKYIIGFSSYLTMGKASILIVSDDGENMMETKVDIIDEEWKKTVYLPKGKYYIKILAQDEELELGFEYELYIKPAVTVKKETKNIKMSSCHTKKLEPKLGKGSWTTSNKNIVSIDNKNPKDSSTCTVRAKKAGSATITYKNDSGSILKYKITVSSKSTNPLEDAYFSMDSVGGLKPTIFIANNSDKKIKYIDLKVSFYNSVGDKVRNEIGGYTYSNLQITGYIKPWSSDWYEWNPVFYNSSASKMKIETMKITYADGSKKTINLNKKYSIY